MEYLMTYGWAILVVLVVGAGMWRMGVFSLGGSVAPTSSGFELLKPLLPTCQMGHRIWLCPMTGPWDCWNGFTCEFANVAGSGIKLKNVDVRVNEKYCEATIIDILPRHIDLQSAYVYRMAFSDSLLDPVAYCYDERISYDCTGVGLDVPRDTLLNVVAMSVVPPFGSIGPCVDPKPGEPYDVSIDITYELSAAGSAQTRHSTGKVRVPGS
jgi:hypothetical protein